MWIHLYLAINLLPVFAGYNLGMKFQFGSKKCSGNYCLSRKCNGQRAFTNPTDGGR